ncbi:TetR/AcrR family transcriptional regulator [Phytoactinopolyspora limicola]|uniref:TetR/AcrR family transcriptional regulator n=1 Tax=Phytoactinopolyspora limicola TaxID=2715536 RepID=UPI00140BA035|nr:TetR/AcrR family transcriptional regulator [Phytoactinopolyspora limicola]
MTSVPEVRPASGVRERTRRAILDAAAQVWSREPTAALGEIADRAEVSRSTLHRYFPERQDLIRALLKDSQVSMDRVVQQVGVGTKPAVQALEDLLRGLLDAGDRLVFLFSDAQRYYAELDEDAEDTSVTDLIRQAQADGDIAADLTPDWVEAACYALVYVGAQSVVDGTVPRHVAADQAVRTFLHGVAER